MKLSEVRSYHKIWKSVNGDKRYSDWFNGKYRVYLDLIDDVKLEPKVPASATQLEVFKVLSENGYDLKDYAMGIAVKPENPKNEFKIGRILNRFNPVLKNQFDSDITREGVKLNKSGLKVVISKHPADIVSMSTNRGWTSCMHLYSGHNRRYIAEDVKEGTLIAYLIRDNDLSIKNPIARCLIKPYINSEKVSFLIPENRVYGTDKKGFRETVECWLNKNQRIQKGIYQLNKALYNDGRASVMLGFDKSYTINSMYGNIVIICDTANKFGIVNKNGDSILDCEYLGIQMDHGYPNFYRTIKSIGNKNKVGGVVVSPSGEIISTLEPQYNGVYAVNDECFMVADVNGFYGVVNMNNEVIIDIKYRQINSIGVGSNKKNFVFLREPNNNNDVKIFNLKTREVAFGYTVKNGCNVSMLSDNPALFIFSESKPNYTVEQTVLNEKGEIIIDKCSGVNTLSPTQLSVRKDVVLSNGMVKERSYAIFDIEKNKYISDFEFTSIAKLQMVINGVVSFFYKVTKLIDKKKLEVIIDMNGKEIFKDKGWEQFNAINNTSLFVVSNLGSDVSAYKRKSAIIDMNNGEFIIPFEKNYTWFDLTNPYKNGLIISYRSDIEYVPNTSTIKKAKYKYGIVNHLTGAELLEPIYDLIKVYATGIFFKKDELWGFMDKNGELVVETKYKSIIHVKAFLREEKEKIKAQKIAEKLAKKAKI